MFQCQDHFKVKVIFPGTTYKHLIYGSKCFPHLNETHTQTHIGSTRPVGFASGKKAIRDSICLPCVAFAELDRFCVDECGARLPCIVTGDFNSQPGSVTHEFLARAKASATIQGGAKALQKQFTPYQTFLLYVGFKIPDSIDKNILPNPHVKVT